VISQLGRMECDYIPQYTRDILACWKKKPPDDLIRTPVYGSGYQEVFDWSAKAVRRPELVRECVETYDCQPVAEREQLREEAPVGHLGLEEKSQERQSVTAVPAQRHERLDTC
jgi:hypothetical protein